MTRFPVQAVIALSIDSAALSACNTALPDLTREPEVTRTYEDPPPRCRPRHLLGETHQPRADRNRHRTYHAATGRSAH